MVFVTNHLKLAAATIAAIYQGRWQIKIFKALKQSLRIKTFVGKIPTFCLTQLHADCTVQLIELESFHAAHRQE